MKLRQILSEKWKEALQAVLPIITIVLALSFTIAPLSPSVLLCFLMGAVLILVGMMFFTTGAETAMTPMGERIGTAMGISDDFGLTVRWEDGSTETLTSGEVSVRGLYDYV